MRRCWADGALLRAAVGAEFAPLEVPLRGPSSADLGDRVQEAREWAQALTRASRDGANFDLVHREIGGRLVGRSRIPARAVVSAAQAWRLIGVVREIERFRAVIDQTGEEQRDWVLAHPHAALDAADEWPAVLAAFEWISANRGAGRWLREVTAAGVDTKLIERRRGVLAGMLDVPARADAFARALGFATKPATVRVRFDPRVFGMPAGVSEAVLRLDELDGLECTAERALIVENEVTYLSVPIPERGIVLWGKGYDAAVPASLRWLREIPVSYWGDIDTHGFAILARVRAHLPHAQSVLMDADTLLAHRDRWGHESKPTNAAIADLQPEEQDLYEALVTDRLGANVRLEQERVDWGWVLTALERVADRPLADEA